MIFPRHEFVLANAHKPDSELAQHDLARWAPAGSARLAARRGIPTT